MNSIDINKYSQYSKIKDEIEESLGINNEEDEANDEGLEDDDENFEDSVDNDEDYDDEYECYYEDEEDDDDYDEDEIECSEDYYETFNEYLKVLATSSMSLLRNITPEKAAAYLYLAGNMYNEKQ